MIRPPYIDTHKDDVPAGCVMITGTHLMQRARHLKIPFGVAQHRNEKYSWITDGIVIFKEDKEKWDAYVPKAR